VLLEFLHLLFTPEALGLQVRGQGVLHGALDQLNLAHAVGLHRLLPVLVPLTLEDKS